MTDQPFACLAAIQHVALDLDGTLYCGERVFPCTAKLLAVLDRLRIGRSFVTNNSSYSNEHYVDRLCGLGIAATLDEVFTSTDATLELLRETQPDAQRLFVLGTPSLQSQFEANGYALADARSTSPPDAVIVGYDSTLQYERLCKAAYWIERGLPYLATHLDRVCPTDSPTVLIDCGSICAALEHATGRSPDEVAGKPGRRMLDSICRKHGLQPRQLAMVGDRLYTDMEMAHAAGALAVLVLSGEATAADAAECSPPPDLILQDVGELATGLVSSE